MSSKSLDAKPGANIELPPPPQGFVIVLPHSGCMCGNVTVGKLFLAGYISGRQSVSIFRSFRAKPGANIELPPPPQGFVIVP